MTTNKNIKVITTLSEFETLADQWDCVAGNNGSICRLHGWNRAWWHGFGSSDDSFELHHIIAYDSQNQPAVIAPMLLTRRTLRGIPMKVLQFAANGHTPSAGLICKGDHPELTHLLTSLMQYLGSFAKWDLVELQKMNTEDPVFDQFKDLASQGKLLLGTQLSLESPYIPIDGEWDDFLKSKSSKFRKVMRNKVNRMKRAGNLDVERISLGPGKEHPPFEHILAEMTSVSKRSWKRKLGRDLETDTAAHTLYRGLLSHFGPLGMIDVWFFRQDGEPLAFEFHLKHGGVLYPIRADMDASIKDFSPGSLLEYTILKEHFERKEIAEYNSCGSTYEYLLKWTDNTRVYLGLQLFNKSLRARALYYLEYKLLPTARRIRQAIRPSAKGKRSS